MKELREGLETYYLAFTKKVSAMNVLTPTEFTKAFVGHVNKLIADTLTAYRQHKSQIGLWTNEGEREDEEAEAKGGSEEVRLKLKHYKLVEQGGWEQSRSYIFLFFYSDE